MDGVSMLYSADDAKAADRRTTQYFEMFGNRGIYHEGWVACTRHSIPWLMVADCRRVKDDVWELYNVDEDFSQANNLAAQEPRQAQGAAGALHEGGRAQPRAADRRPPLRALQPRHRRPARPAGRAQVAHRLPRHDGHDGERLHQREGRAPHHHRRGRAEGRQDQRRDHRAGRLLRRLGALHEGRQAAPRVQLVRARAHEHRRRPPLCARQAHDRLRVHPRRRPSPAPAASRS